MATELYYARPAPAYRSGKRMYIMDDYGNAVELTDKRAHQWIWILADSIQMKSEYML